MEGKQEDFRNLGPQKGLVVVQSEVFLYHFQDLTIHDELSSYLGNPKWDNFVNPHELKDSF